MIAALDSTPLTVSSGGVRRYTEELCRALRAEFPADEYHLLSDQTVPVRGLDKRWWTIGVQRAMKRLHVDVLHGTDFSVPYLPLRPSVLSIHDLSPWLNPAWHSAADRVRRRTPWLVRLRIATLILTDTEAMRRAVIDHFHLKPERVIAVHLAADKRFRPVPQNSPTPYFVCVGTLEPRKNVPALLEAWRIVKAKYAVDLVIAGRRREDGPVLTPEPGLRILGEVADEDLPALYSGAIASVYPTAYEGFGLPVLEAMQCGAPVITTRDPAVTEVSGGAAIHVEPSELVASMSAMLDHPEERSRRSELSLQRAAEFSWSRTARLTREVYYEAIRRFHA